MTLECKRLIKLHRCAFITSGMSHHVYIKTAVGYCYQFYEKKANTSAAAAALVRNLRTDACQRRVK